MSSLPITIYEYLKMDHKKVDNLFKQFEDSNLKERRKEIVDLILQELFVHLTSEQETFYAILEKHYESEKEALHGREEHEEIEAQIKLIKEASHMDASYDKKVMTLKDIVQHHVKEEEGDMFDKAKAVFSDEEALVIKEQMHSLKGKLLEKLESGELKI